MKFNKFNIGFTALIMSASLILLVGCNEPSLTSQWRDREILIDGLDKEWEGCRLYTDQKTGTTIGVYNDEDYAYICLVTSDEDVQQQFISQGLIVWLNETGNKKEQFGINYPTGLQYVRASGEQGPRRDVNMEGRGQEPPAQRGEMEGSGPDQSAQPQGTPTLSLTDVEIMDEDENRKSIQMDELVNYSIGARFGFENNRLVYELIIPLKESAETPYAALSTAGLIGLGFEIGNFNTPRRRSRSVSGISGMGGTSSSDMGSGGMSGGGMGGGGMGGGGMGGGGMGGGGMGGGGMGGGGMGGGGMSDGGMSDASMSGGGMGGGMPSSQSQSFNIWTKIQLAPKPSDIE